MNEIIGHPLLFLQVQVKKGDAEAKPGPVLSWTQHVNKVHPSKHSTQHSLECEIMQCTFV